jgi:hypothetical protein
MFNKLSMLKILKRDVKILVFTRGIRSFSAAILTVSFTIYLSKLGASAVTLGLVFTGMSLFSAVRSFLEGSNSRPLWKEARHPLLGGVDDHWRHRLHVHPGLGNSIGYRRTG